MTKQTLMILGLTLASAFYTPLGHTKANIHKIPTSQLDETPSQSPDKEGKLIEKQSFTQQQQQLIQEYYYKHRYDKGRTITPKRLPQHNEKTGKLPLNWQKDIQLGQAIPLNIYQAALDIPYELEEILPKEATGIKIIKIENKMIRVQEETRIVLDTFDIDQ